MRTSLGLALVSFVLYNPLAAFAQEPPYFVTYSDHLEDRGDLEIGLATTAGDPRGGRAMYAAPWLEVEYGVRNWWTTELYVEGVVSRQDGSGFSGWRLENRFRLFQREHLVNPLLYVEYESINEASRIQKEVVGTGPLDFAPISDLRQQRSHEIEGKLVLSSDVRGWNISENAIIEKNLSRVEGIEYGYAVAASHALGAKLNVGVEAFGGLGSSIERSLDETRHFVAPVLGWRVTDRTTLKASVGVGLSQPSDRYLFRIGWTYELRDADGK